MNLTDYQLIEPVSADVILALVRHAFGERVRILRCDPITHVQFNTVYDIQLADPAVRAILRIAPPSSKPLFSFERTMMSAEQRIGDIIRAAGVPIPPILAFDGSRTIIDRDFIFVEYVDSVPMSDATVPTAAKPALQRELGVYTARIHGIAGARFGWPMADGSIRGSERWSEVIYGLFDELCLRCVNASLLSATAATALLRTTAAHRPLFDSCTEPRLVHNDLWEPNVLVVDHGDSFHIVAIIDADRAMFADREFDFVLWSQDPHFLDGYGTPLNSAPEAVLRRQFYSLCMSMFCTWAYGVQINKPDLLAGCKSGMEAELVQLLLDASCE